MALNFKDVASKPIGEIERPPLPPVGTYRWRIEKLPTIDEDVGGGKWDVLRVNVRAVEALDDVDMEDYKGEVTNILNNVSFMFNKEDEAEFDKTLFNARRFFEQHVRCADEKESMTQAINQSVNGEFLGTIAWRQDKNDSEVFHANIARTAPVE